MIRFMFAAVVALIIAISLLARANSINVNNSTSIANEPVVQPNSTIALGGMSANIDTERINKSSSRVKAGIINVKDLGAKGDGVSDDTSAIQRALDARGKVFLPAGSYIVSKRLLIYSNTQIMGTGVNSIIKPVFTPQAGASTIMCYGDAGNIKISNLALDGSDSPTDAESYHGIYVQNNSDVSISNCHIHDYHGDGIYADGLNNNLTIKNNNIRSNYRNGIAIVQGTNFVITGNLVETGYVAGIDLEPYQASAKVTCGQINQNVITGIYPGITLSGATGEVKNIIVQKNIIKLNNENSNARAILSYSAADCTIRNNIIDNASIGMWGTTILNSTIQQNKFSNISNSAIQISASNCKFRDNCIYNTAWCGVNISGDIEGTGNTVENNYIWNVKSNAIAVTKNTKTIIRNNFIIDSGCDGFTLIALNNSSNCQIIKNVIVDCKLSNIPSSAINLTNCSNSFVSQNYWQGTQYDRLFDTLGTNNVFKDNKYQTQ